MEERFSSYLSEIGLLNETDSSSLIKKDDKASNKSFADTSFECLKNYFDNLDEEQKKYMSQYIPTKYIEISDKIRRTKLKSIIIQLILRNKILILKFFLIWKNNINILGKLNNSNTNENIKENENEKDNSELNSGENLFNNIANNYLNNQNNNKKDIDNNISKYNIVNIDNNVDIDNKNMTKSEEEERAKSNSISFGNIILKNNCNNGDEGEKNIKKKISPKNIKKPKNTNKNNNINKNKGKSSINPYIYRNNTKNINQIKKEINLNSYKTINTNNITNNIRKQTNRSQYSSNNNNNSSIRNSSKKNNLHTSLEEKEIKELQECTFKPKINNLIKITKRTLSQNDINSSLIIKNNNDNSNNQKREEEIQLRFEKLYKDNEKYKLSKEMKAIELEHMMSRNAPFIPNIKKKFKKRLYKMRQNSEGNFEERQREYLNKRNKHSAELKNRINSDFEELCSFNPKITNDKGEYYQMTIKEKINKKPVFIRLYEDVKDRKNYQMQREMDKYNKIMDLSNFINPQKKFNFETINKLYENKEKKDRIDKIRKKVEEEEGMTFKPYISENSYLRGVNGNFYERGQKLLNDRESFYEEENKKYNEGYRNSVDKKAYTKEERKQIINNIINRLYNDFVQKNNKPMIKEKDKKEGKIRNFKSYFE